MDEDSKNELLASSIYLFNSFRMYFDTATNGIGNYYLFEEIKEKMEIILTNLELNEQDLLEQLKIDVEILQDDEATKKLLKIALKWEPVLFKLGYMEVNKYYLRNLRVNPNLYRFLISSTAVINDISDTGNLPIEVDGHVSREDFCKFMLAYDPHFEKFLFYLFLFFLKIKKIIYK
jgi:hypothetical protein